MEKWMDAIGQGQMRAIAALAGSLLLGGCETYHAAQDSIRADARRADQQIVDANVKQPIPRTTNVRVVDGGSLPTRDVRRSSGDPLPAGVPQVTLITRRPITLQEFASLISRQAGLRVVVTQDKDDNSTAAAAAAAPSKDATYLNPFAPGGAGPTGAITPAQFTAAFATGSDEALALECAPGPLERCLDVASARFNVGWTFRAGVVVLYRMETRLFNLAPIATDTKTSTSISNFSQTQNSSGAGTASTPPLGKQESSVDVTIKMWDDLMKGLNGLLAGKGRIAGASSTGIVSVTAPPYEMGLISGYISTFNELQTRAVAVNVQVLSVRLSKSDDYGLNLRAAFKDAGLTYVLQGPTALVDSAAAIGQTAVISPPAGSTAAKFDGSQLAIQALSTQGDVTTETSNTVNALNNQYATVLDANQDTYIASTGTPYINSGNGGSVGSIATIQPGSYSTGITINVLPRILSNKQVLLQLAFTQIDLRQLKDLTSGTQSVQGPNLDSRSVQQMSPPMKTGETLMITGFLKREDRTTKSGIGDSDFLSILGGRRAGTKGRSMLVILITPQIRSGVQTNPDLNGGL